MLGWMRQMGQGRHRVRKTYNTDTAYRAVTQLILLLIFNTLIHLIQYVQVGVRFRLENQIGYKKVLTLLLSCHGTHREIYG